MPVNPQTGFTSYVFIEGGRMVAGSLPTHDLWLELMTGVSERRQTLLLPLESGPHLNLLGTSPSAIRDNFMSFSSCPFHNLFIRLVMPARPWVWGHPPENGEPASDHSPEENGFPLQQSPTVNSAWKWDLRNPSPAHARMLTDLTLTVTTAGVSL